MVGLVFNFWGAVQFGAVFYLTSSSRLSCDPVAYGFAAPALCREFEALGSQLFACVGCCLLKCQVHALLLGQWFVAGGFHLALRCSSCHLAWSRIFARLAVPFAMGSSRPFELSNTSQRSTKGRYSV